VCASNSNTTAAPWQEQAAASPAKSTGEGSRTSHHPLPFSALPHQLRRDLKGNQTAISLAAALLEYARTKPYCYPTTAHLADDLGVCQNTIRAALRALQASGWIRIVLGSNQPNGRRIFLCWLEPTSDSVKGTPTRTPFACPQADGAREAGQVSDPLQPAAVPLQPSAVPLQPSAAEIRMSEEFNERNVRSLPEISDAPAPTTPLPPSTTPLPASTPILAPTPAPVAAVPLLPAPGSTPAQGHVRPLKEVLAGLPGSDDQAIRSAAWRLAHHLRDIASVAFFMKCLQLVAMGGTPVARLLAAFTVADKTKESARKPGALFCSIWNSYQPPPKPSEIRYYQTPSRAHSTSGPVQCMTGAIPNIGATASATPGTPEPAPTAEDLAALREYAANQGHPLCEWSRRRLAELGL